MKPYRGDALASKADNFNLLLKVSGLGKKINAVASSVLLVTSRLSYTEKATDKNL